MRYSPGCSGDGCHCDTSCNLLLSIPLFSGGNSTTVGFGSTEQNGNWERLAGQLHVTTGDAIITWDAGANDWTFLFLNPVMGSSWEIPGSLATDYTKSLRIIFNFVDNNNFDFIAIRLWSYALQTLFFSFGERSGGVDTILLPVAGGGGAASKQHAWVGARDLFRCCYKNDIMHVPDGHGTCGAAAYSLPVGGRTWYRPRVNNIVGIGTDPTWTGDVDIDEVYIAVPATSQCPSTVQLYCTYPTLPCQGATNDIVANTLTATINGTPQTCYPNERDGDGQYRWVGATANVILKANGDLEVGSGADNWSLSNGGSPRTDADAWSGLNIPPVAPNVKTCTLTGNY